MSHNYQTLYAKLGTYAEVARFCGVNESTVRRALQRKQGAALSGVENIEVSERILFIGDVHAPAEHPDYLAFLVAVRDKYKLDTAISVGDFIDFHAMSYHESDPDLPGPGDELDEGAERLQAYAAEFPKLSITTGNHCNIPARKALTNGLPKAFLRGYNELFNLPDTWFWTTRPLGFTLECGVAVAVQHAVSPSLEAGRKNLRDSALVQGHHHFTAGVAWASAPRHQLFFLSCGCGVNPAHPAMAYADKGVLKMPCLGCGMLLNGDARFVPMWVRGNGRWNGVVP